MIKNLDPDSLKTFPGLTAAAFQHPDDRKATAGLQQIPVFPQVLKAIRGGIFEKAETLQAISSNVRLGPSQGRSIYSKFVKAAQILNVQKLPDLFMSSEHVVNAYATGMEHYRIILNPPLVDMLTEPELLAILGHELGHVKCNHMINKTLAHWLYSFGAPQIAKLVPVLGSLALTALQWPLFYWSRMAEFSCDRAALLVTQDPEVVASALAKIAGWSERVMPEVNLEALLEQAKEYNEADEKTLESVLKIVMLMQSEAYSTHPLPVIRVQRILQWGQSDQYKDILAGKYPREEIVTMGPAGQRYCASCGQPMPPSDDFCGTCGAIQSKAIGGPGCPKCGRPATGTKFCPKCGTPMAQGSIAAVQ
jgi:Zn-dependent protease with chaperone function